MNIAYVLVELRFETQETNIAAIEKEFYKMNFTEGNTHKLVGVAELHDERGNILYQADVSIVG